MELFGQKQGKPNCISISGSQLCTQLENAISEASRGIEGKFYVCGSEIIFEFNDTVHFTCVRYDKKA